MRRIRSALAFAAVVAALAAGVVGAGGAEATGRCELRFYDGHPSVVC